MTTLKAGTRCECRSELHAEQFINPLEHRGGCSRDAVRMVTTRAESFARGVPGTRETQHTADVPMCEPCAAWHEAHASK